MLLTEESSECNLRVELTDKAAGYGDYTFCFDNSFSVQSEKRVFFEFFLMDASGQFLGGFDEKVDVGADVLQTLDTHLDNFQACFILAAFLYADELVEVNQSEF